VVDFMVLNTNNPKFNEESFPKIIDLLNHTGFIPGEINGKRVTTTLALREPVICSIGSQTIVTKKIRTF